MPRLRSAVQVQEELGPAPALRVWRRAPVPLLRLPVQGPPEVPPGHARRSQAWHSHSEMSAIIQTERAPTHLGTDDLFLIILSTNISNTIGIQLLTVYKNIMLSQSFVLFYFPFRCIHLFLVTVMLYEYNYKMDFLIGFQVFVVVN